MKNRIWILMAIGLIIRLLFLLKANTIGWDASVYIGMGKYIFTLGHLGIWEPLRPPLLPLILGLVWKTGLSLAFIGRALEIMFSLAAVYMTYLIGRKYRTEDEGLIAAAIVSLTPVFFEFSLNHYTEIPSTFFALLAVYLFMEKKHILSGAMAGLAFLTKFPQGIVAFALCMFQFTNIRKGLKIGLSFMAVISIYLLSNYLMYGSILKPIAEGNYIIKYAGIWLYAQPWWFYAFEMAKANFLYVFSIAGIFIMVKKGERLIPALALLFIIYFSTNAHKEPRFMILFIPYFALLASVGIRRLFKQKYVTCAVTIISLALLLLQLPEFPDAYEGKDNFFRHLEGKNLTGEILVSHPYISMHSSKETIPIYYMVFDSELAKQWTGYIEKNSDRIGYLFIDTCEGGMLCPPWDNECVAEREKLISKAEELFTRELYEEKGECKYYIFKNQV